MVAVLNVALQNHPGSLAEVLEILARAEINVDAIEAEAQGDFGTVRLLTSKPRLATDLLKQDGYDVVINVVSLFGTSPDGPANGRLLLRVNDTKAARKVLGLPE
ncbi:MAG: ACT domain-containing protein [Euryarchaeota archaeon]|nr:ACT domain-containing protein [Euryarchaeota archaeon]